MSSGHQKNTLFDLQAIRESFGSEPTDAEDMRRKYDVITGETGSRTGAEPIDPDGDLPTDPRHRPRPGVPRKNLRLSHYPDIHVENPYPGASDE